MADPAFESLKDGAKIVGSMLFALVAIGVALLIGAAVILWAYRTIF